jgi:flagellar biosynthetic protein FliO
MMSVFYLMAQAQNPPPDVGSSVWDGGGGYGMVMFSLILLFGLLLGVFLYLKRFGFPRASKVQELQILETRPLGGRQFLVVGRVGREKFLLGVCPGRIDYLCALEVSAEEDADSGVPFASVYDEVAGTQE